jgi:hypothetical protein
LLLGEKEGERFRISCRVNNFKKWLRYLNAFDQLQGGRKWSSKLKMVQTPLPLRIFLTEYAHPLNLAEEGSSPLNSAKGVGSKREIHPRMHLSVHYNFIVRFEKMRSVPFKYFAACRSSGLWLWHTDARRDPNKRAHVAEGFFSTRGGVPVCYRNRSPAARLKTAVYAGGAVPRAA